VIWTKAFWKGAAERAIKTAAQSLAGVFVAGVAILDIDVSAGLQIAATITLASLLTSIGNADFVAGEFSKEV
jgi:hypothetical protein